MQSALERINFLKDEINKSNYKYYVEENPYLSDFEYDQMFAELKQLEEQYPLLKTPDSPTQRVGSVSEKFSRTSTNTACTVLIIHTTKMN